MYIESGRFASVKVLWKSILRLSIDLMFNSVSIHTIPNIIIVIPSSWCSQRSTSHFVVLIVSEYEIKSVPILSRLHYSERSISSLQWLKVTAHWMGRSSCTEWRRGLGREKWPSGGLERASLEKPSLRSGSCPPSGEPLSQRIWSPPPPWYFWCGCRGNLTLTTLGRVRVNKKGSAAGSRFETSGYGSSLEITTSVLRRSPQERSLPQALRFWTTRTEQQRERMACERLGRARTHPRTSTPLIPVLFFLCLFPTSLSCFVYLFLPSFIPVPFSFSSFGSLSVTEKLKTLGEELSPPQRLCWGQARGDWGLGRPNVPRALDVLSPRPPPPCPNRAQSSSPTIL